MEVAGNTSMKQKGLVNKRSKPNTRSQRTTVNRKAGQRMSTASAKSCR